MCRDLFCSFFHAGQKIYTKLSTVVNGFPVINGNRRKIDQISLKVNFDIKDEGQGQKSKKTFCSFSDARQNIYTKLSSAEYTSRVISPDGIANTLKLQKMSTFLDF
jgi:hypothetical protein